MSFSQAIARQTLSSLPVAQASVEGKAHIFQCLVTFEWKSLRRLGLGCVAILEEVCLWVLALRFQRSILWIKM